MFCPHILVNCYYLKPEDTGPPTPQNTSMLQHQTMQNFFFFFLSSPMSNSYSSFMSFHYRSWQHYEDRKKETCAIIRYRIMYLKMDRRYFRPGYTWTAEV